ncbi:thioesterase family protein [Sporobolomyces koalae]|uniref:thioesterase family protein n=1 Tax=Sporobolomyces koalae TaxID=500713 RepID=UPI00317669FD
MSMSVVRIPAWSTMLVGSIAAALVHYDGGAISSNSRLLSLVKKAFVLLLVINWRALPFVWHIEFWGLIPKLYYKIWTRGPKRAMSIGKNPFEVRTLTKARVRWSDSDYNMHMSNSSYARVADAARFAWLLELIGPAFGAGCWSPLASTSYTFLHEIPAGAEYEIEVKLVSYDSKWIYYVARFTTAPRKGSTERTLNAVALSRSCFKLRGSRISIPPARVLSYSGLGPATNYERTLQLQKNGKSRQWLQYGAESVARQSGKELRGKTIKGEPGWDEDGMESFEAERVKGSSLAERMGDVSGLL